MRGRAFSAGAAIAASQSGETTAVTADFQAAVVSQQRQRDANHDREWFDQSLGSGDRPALERLLDLFAALDEQLQPENGRGCPFFMAPAEIADESDPAHRHAVALNAWVNERFGELVREVTRPVVDPDQLADALTLIFEGSYGVCPSARRRTGPA